MYMIEAKSKEQALTAWGDVAAALNDVMSAANKLLCEEHACPSKLHLTAMKLRIQVVKLHLNERTVKRLHEFCTTGLPPPRARAAYGQYPY